MHGLRHYSATQMLGGGIDLRVHMASGVLAKVSGLTELSST
jgi:site-specific recombinase XerD